MTKNQLKLRIWNILNGSRLSEKILQRIETEMTEDEIGAFVNLFCDSEVCKEFLINHQTTEAIEEEFCSLEKYKEILRNCLDTAGGKHFAEMQRKVFGYRLEDFISAFNRGRNEEQELDLFCQTEFVLLNYLRVLRAKIDVPSTPIQKEEKGLLDALETNVEGYFLAASLGMFLMFTDYIDDQERVQKLVTLKSSLVQDYVQGLGEALDMIDYLMVVFEKNRW